MAEDEGVIGVAYPTAAGLAFSGNVSVFAMPEPTTLALFAVGLAGLAARKRKA